MKKQAKKANMIAIPFDRDHELNFKLAVMCLLGMSNYYISVETGYSYGQINYRIRKFGLAGVRADYRNGYLNHAKTLIELGISVEDIVGLRREAMSFLRAC